MNNSNGFPIKGDIITSPKFAYGYYTGEEKVPLKIITVDGSTSTHSVGYTVSEEERVAIVAKSGTIPPKLRTVELGAHDKSRGSAKFVVEEARMEGGSDSPRDPWPDGWHITARRLSPEGKYDSSGEIIDFYMSGCFNCMVDAKDIKVVGKMKMRFV